MGEARRTAVFDLDETLTRRDTYLPFLFGYLRRHPRRWTHVARLPFTLMAVWRWRDRAWLKEQFLLAFIGGEPRARVEAWAADFAEQLALWGMRERGVTQLREHQRAGDRVLLASASFDVYVNHLGAKLGMTDIIASRVRWDGRDRVYGLDGANCKSQEKLAQIKSRLGDEATGTGVVAYSDSHADLPLLTWAEQGIAVCPSRKLARAVAKRGLSVARW